MDVRTDSADSRAEILSPELQHLSGSGGAGDGWRLNVGDFQVPDRPKNPPLAARVFLKAPENFKILQEARDIVKGFREMDAVNQTGCMDAPTEDDLKQLAKSERLAILISNVSNLVLFAAKVYASIESKSLAVIASTLDSLLDLLSGFILWFTSHAMRNPNQYNYPIGKNRMQPVGIIVSSVMATLGFQILLESGRQLVTQSHSLLDAAKEKWMIGIMVSATVVKFVLMVYCRSFENQIVRAYAQDHFFDVITNSVGLVTAVLAVRYYWWMDPVAQSWLIALYTINTWAKTVMENVWSLVGRSAPPDLHLGSHYFVEVDIVLPGTMPLSQAHDIGETLQEKLELLQQVERAFVHVDFEFTHRPEHKPRS
ncbi:unnamed protein product [Spirodela intermedia]|uniref:Cation efflux protein cytoplasmic domain-containing protein n=1 Tax=Spirodela intermedia TaxID=51605 RepID=A0ABN7EAX8_SPIIN|nr:unnamed protein product [Spirodela intermedia]